MPIDRSLIRKKSSIYAEVLIQAAKATDSVFAVTDQLEQVLMTIRSHAELRNTLMERTIPGADRANILKDVFSGFNPALLEVLCVMVDRDDLGLLSRVNERSMDLAEEALDAVIIDVTTVLDLDDGLRKSIKEKFSAQFGKGVLLREHKDPSLLGGIVLSAHGSRIDASVSFQLDNARATLMQAW